MVYGMIFENGERQMDRNDSYEETIDSERKAIENNNKIRDSIASVLKQQEKYSKLWIK